MSVITDSNINPTPASELSKKALQDNTPYIAREVGEAMCHDIEKELRKCIDLHNPIIMEDEYCLVRVIATDNLVKNMRRVKYYAWPYLPSPRPNQSVFLYNKPLDKITKRLWVLPSAFTMSELASQSWVPEEYRTMQAWSLAFFDGQFWEYVRYDQGITMLSEKEYISQHREELIKAGCKPLSGRVIEPFDFSKIHIKSVVDPDNSISEKNVL